MFADDLAEVLARHHPSPPATPDELAAWEREHGIQLDAELRALYLAANGASLFRLEDCPYEILPLSRVRPAHLVLYGRRAADVPPTPANVWAFADILDGNYVGFAAEPGRPFAIYDIDHETWHLPPRRKVVAASFGEFLSRALRGPSIGPYWLHGDSPSAS